MRFILISFLLLPLFLIGQQSEDPILFSVEGNPVHVSEFEYIYNKNNGSKADYSRTSLEEYLDLYVKFKLKVQRAKDLKLDTIPNLQRELEGYRRQLANSYLTDKEVSDRLAREVYSRMKKDIEVAHILISVPKNATPSQIEEARAKTERIKDYIDKGASFEEMAKGNSDDKNSKARDGYIGFITAMLPNGFYELENIIYSLEPGEISDPVRTSVGFHIVKVISSRPARGRVEAAHILIRKKQKNQADPAALAKIDSIYNLLEAGMSFEELVRLYSEDKTSNTKGGNIGIFGINRFEKGFEDAAFGIEKEGAYSKPVETSIGWHIIKLIDALPIESYERVKRKLQADIAKDDRYELAQNSMIDRIKSDNGFSVNQTALEEFANGLSDNFLTYKWKVPADLDEQNLFSLGGQTRTTKDFAKFLRTNSRSRLRMNNNTPKREAVDKLFDEYVKNEAIKFEEAHLEDKYPDFKALMREYEEGILLFEATKLAVWDKASQDTIGLRNYYNENKENYMWEERAEIATVVLENIEEKRAAKIYGKAEKWSVDKLVNKCTKKGDQISATRQLVEKSNTAKLGELDFSEGTLSPLDYNNIEKKATFKKVTSILPPSIKKMSEARGYIIADYQDHLEKIWVNQLKEDYNVKVDQNVFEGLIK
jgi:peptidyl-prolyl cis-trans isomerase SurA